MQVPLEINFHNMDRSEAMEARVQSRVARLERITDAIIKCRVVLEAVHKQPHGSPLSISIKLGLPGKDIVVKREQRRHDSKGDTYQVIGVAFGIVERQLEEHLRISRHDVKAHDGPTYARIVKLYHEQEYGFIETPVQLNVYFHSDVVDGKAFDSLEVGNEVLYTLAAEEGPMGPQASRV
ncbi:MAG: HPF/RaiA family ribosome-associated protein, partial [Alphaproteobacteria bacterium]|nr:HPF/RaiA family ribosome-associated protein [Alphaproteobacteria bacterium]